jgi:hypothetical protein
MQCTARSVAFACSASKGSATSTTSRCSVITRGRSPSEPRSSPPASMLCHRKHTLSVTSKPATSARRLSLRVCAIQVSGPSNGNGGPSDGNKLDAPVILLMKEKVKIKCLTLPRIFAPGLVRKLKAHHSPPLEYTTISLTVCQQFPRLPSRNALSVGVGEGALVVTIITKPKKSHFTLELSISPKLPIWFGIRSLPTPYH